MKNVKPYRPEVNVEKLFSMLKTRGISLQEFSSMTGISDSALRNWRGGKREPSPELQRVCAGALKISVSELFYETTPDKQRIVELEKRNEFLEELLFKWFDFAIHRHRSQFGEYAAAEMFSEAQKFAIAEELNIEDILTRMSKKQVMRDAEDSDFESGIITRPLEKGDSLYPQKKWVQTP